MYFLPTQLPRLDTFSLFGVTLFVSHLLGELLFKTRLIPKISGYILAGVILGPNVLNWVNSDTIKEMTFFSDISIGLVLFIIGRNLNFIWLKNDISLLFTSLFEFGLSLGLIFCFLKYIGWRSIDAFSSGVILSTVSPAILLLVKEDLKAEGPIIRRSLIITSLNNVMALLLFSLLYPYFPATVDNYFILLMHSLYRIIGSMVLGFLFFKLLEWVNYYILPKKHKEQSIMLIATLMIALWAAKALNMSAFISLMVMGVATRNLDTENIILESGFGDYLHIFAIPLFFITGCYLNLSGFYTAPFVIVVCIVARVCSKFLAVLCFRSQANMTLYQALSLGGTLVPLSGFAMGMSGILGELNPSFGAQLNSIVYGCIGILGIIGPFIVQRVLINSNEAFETVKKV